MNASELKSKEYKVLYEIYRHLFAASTPAGDFNYLIENAVIDSDGRKHIPFLDYEIDNHTMDNIIQTILKENKIPKREYQKYITTVYLGCSPKSRSE
jgi:hypothetical protein